MKAAYPKQMILEVTSRCNLRCKYCPNINDPDPKDMPLDMVVEILDKVDQDLTVIPWMNGEPLLHPDYAEILREITSRNLRAYVTTNGIIWNEDVSHILTHDNSIYQIIVSLDGLHNISSKSIEAARPGSDRDRVVASARGYKNWTKRVNKEDQATDVAVKICERGQDYGEIEEYVKFWLKELDFVVVGKRLGEVNDESMRMYPCQYFDNNFIVIRADGKMVPCAYHNEMVNKNAYPLGNIMEYRTISDAYNNRAYRQLREDHRHGFYPPPCDKCGFAYTGEGFRGMVSFNEKGLEKVYFHQDYYNQFFSLNKKWKPFKYYGLKGESNANNHKTY